LFLSIDEGWWAWPPLTVTCTVLSWWSHVLSITRDVLKSYWNWTGSVRSNVALGFKVNFPPDWIGCNATLCFTLADDPSLSYFEELDMAENPLLSICPIPHRRASSWTRLFFKPAISRNEISWPGDVTLMSITVKSGLPELAPLLSAWSPVSPVASLRYSTSSQCDRGDSRRRGRAKPFLNWFFARSCPESERAEMQLSDRARRCERREGPRWDTMGHELQWP